MAEYGQKVTLGPASSRGVCLQVYLLRHGIAEDGKPGTADRDRALTAEGKRKLREVLRVAKAAEVRPEIILSSPYKRAKETAVIAAELLGHKGEIIYSNALVPSGDPAEVWTEIRSLRAAQILLSSHEPLCSRLAAFLLNAPSLDIDYKKGALARISIPTMGPAPRGVLEWLLTAKLAEPPK